MDSRERRIETGEYCLNIILKGDKELITRVADEFDFHARNIIYVHKIEGQLENSNAVPKPCSGCGN